MTFDNLAKTLTKELGRNKKKSAILGVMCLVALYFWAPLIWGWFAGDGSEESVALPETTPSVAAPSTPPPTTPTARSKTERLVPWDRLLSMMEQDQHMTTAALPQGMRNPFAEMVINSSPVERDVDTTAVPAAMTDPAEIELGLELSAVIIGPRIQMATINGRTYRQGEQISIDLSGAVSTADSVDNDDLPPAVATSRPLDSFTSIWTITRIEPDGVVLRHSEGTIRRLELQRASLSGDDSISLSRVGVLPLSQ